MVPAAFWLHPAIREAFDLQHMGRIARAYRHHPFNAARYGRDGISQELLGEWLGLTQAQVSRVENGPPSRNLDTLAHWARTLRLPSELLWFRLPGEQAPADDAGYLPAALPGTSPGASFQLVPVGRSALHDPDAAAMHAFRAADRQVGGGHLYASVVKYLQSDLAPRLFGSDAGPDNRIVFTAAAAFDRDGRLDGPRCRT